MATKSTPPTRSRARELTQAQRKARFLKELTKRANVSAAARAAMVDRSTPYHWREMDEEFARAWDEAVEVAVDALEGEAWRRAAIGVLEPVFQKGAQVGQIRRYSDTLMITLLKAHRREKYSEKQQLEHTGPGGEALPPAVVNVYLPDNGRGDRSDEDQP